MHILNTLGPVFLVIALGAVLRRFRFLDDHSVRVISAACYWVGLPCLLVLKIGTAVAAAGAARSTTLVLLTGTAILLVLSLPVALVLRLKPKGIATFMHVVFRGNLAYLGLPVVCFAFAGSIFEGQAEAVAAMSLAVVVVVYNIIAVILHLLSTHSISLLALRRVGVKLVTNPLLLACAAGLAWNKLAHANGIVIPIILERTFGLLGQFALPLALLCVGSSLVTTPVRSVAAGSIVSALMKTCLGPAAGLVAARLIGVGSMEAGVACILLGCPSAVASYVMAEQLDGDTSLAAGAIVTSTLMSALTFSVIIGMMG